MGSALVEITPAGAGKVPTGQEEVKAAALTRPRAALRSLSCQADKAGGCAATTGKPNAARSRSSSGGGGRRGHRGACNQPDRGEGLLGQSKRRRGVLERGAVGAIVGPESFRPTHAWEELLVVGVVAGGGSKKGCARSLVLLLGYLRGATRCVIVDCVLPALLKVQYIGISGSTVVVLGQYCSSKFCGSTDRWLLALGQLNGGLDGRRLASSLRGSFTRSS